MKIHKVYLPFFMGFIALQGLNAQGQTPSQESNQILVRGVVTDSATNEPLVGVGVRITGSADGTATDSDGGFSLNAPGDAVLLISFIGYNAKEVAVNGRSNIEIPLVQTSIDLNQVVVVGFGQQKKLTVTGAIVSVGTKELKMSPSASLANSLAGRLTGVTTVQNSGRPGGDDPFLLIRGVGSLNSASAAPLILVDGVERSFTQLDPNEVESISILKDASATAVFGVRGANGVMLVTTKRGAEGAPKISVTTSYGLQQPSRLPDFADSYTHATLYNQSQLNDDPNAVLLFSEEAIEAFRTNSDPIIYPNTDWIKYILKPVAPQTQSNINVSGGSEKVKYFVSLGYLKQDGLFRTFDLDNSFNYTYNRYNYRANLDIEVTKTTTLSLTTGGRSEIRNEPLQNEPQFSIWRNIYFAQPFRGIGVIDGRHIMSDPRYIPGETRDALNGYYGIGYYNVAQNILNLDINLSQRLDFVTQGLSFRIKGSYNSSYTQNKNRNSSRATYLANYLNDLDPNAPDDKTIVYKKIGEDGILGFSEGFNKARDWYVESALSYDRTFGRHHFSGLVLYNEMKNYYPAINVDIPRGYVGLVGRVTYDYLSKYLLDFNIGYNGSENFAPGKRFGIFPAISAGWVLSEENFLKSSSIFNYLKLRGSYGVVGNDRIPDSRFLYLPDSYNANTGGYNFGVNVPQNQLGASEGRIGNPDVTWERSRKLDVAVEFNILNSRLSVIADYFYEYRFNILTRRQTVPGIAGADLPAANIGRVRNSGYEAEVKWRDQKGDFGYGVGANISFARNSVLFMDEVVPNEPYLARTGRRVNQPYGYIFDGYWTKEDVERIEEFPNANYDAKPGDLRYRDLNGDGVIDVDDLGPIGFPNYPEYVLGMNMDFRYKGFDISMLWSGAMNVSRAFAGSFQRPFGPVHGFGLMQFMADGHWTPETAETATFPRMTFVGIENNVKYSDYWLRDASYLRLKNIEFGYSFDVAGRQFFKQLGINSLRIYTNGYNLLTLDKLEVIDPESVPTENAQYPLMKIYNLGLNIEF